MTKINFYKSFSNDSICREQKEKIKSSFPTRVWYQFMKFVKLISILFGISLSQQNNHRLCTHDSSIKLPCCELRIDVQWSQRGYREKGEKIKNAWGTEEDFHARVAGKMMNLTREKKPIHKTYMWVRHEKCSKVCRCV